MEELSKTEMYKRWAAEHGRCECGIKMRNGQRYTHRKSARHQRFMNLEKTHEMFKAYPKHDLTLWRPKTKEMVLRFESPAIFYF